MKARLLVVDDDLVFRESSAELLRQDGYDVAVAADGPAASDAISRERFDLVLLDLRMPGPDGVAVTEVLRQRGERVPILMVSGFGTVDTAVQALQRGADDFLTKPVEPEVLSERVAGLLERRPRPRPPAPDARIVCDAPPMREVLEAIRAVAPTDATVLITGETGTGKDLVARAIHDQSRRRNGPYVAANVAALGTGVMASELFGHVRGAFTGAVRDRPGLFRAAHGGTIFLDEIGDMDSEGQRRLLRVLQEREVMPVGSVRSVPVDVRVLAATNRNLPDAVAAGRFREDLFYRFNVFPIHLPPLRERRDDIPLLVEAILEQLATERGRPAPAVSAATLRLLRSYRWPGNVRELRTAIESAVIRAGDSPRIEAHDLPDAVRDPARAGPVRYQPPDTDTERATIVAALRDAAGVRARAADLLGMGRTTLWRKMKQYGLTTESPHRR